MSWDPDFTTGTAQDSGFLKDHLVDANEDLNLRELRSLLFEEPCIIACIQNVSGQHEGRIEAHRKMLESFDNSVPMSTSPPYLQRPKAKRGYLE